MEMSLLTEVKAILKSLVLSCPEKITIEQLNRDYRDVEGKFIPFRQLGYGNLEEFLRSVPDTLRVFGSGPTAMVCFVANEKSDHIHDMIMKQKKSKPNRPRTRNKRPSVNRNNAYREKNSVPSFKQRGQQLSPYQSVNRNQMAKTLQVKPLSQVQQRTVTQTPVPQRPSLASIPLSSQVLYNLPQPNGILPTPVLSTLQNGIIKTVNAQIYQHQINQMVNLLANQCNVRDPPPPLPRQQNKNISLPTEKKPSLPVKAPFQKKSPNVLNNYDGSAKKTETANSVIQIKPPSTAEVKNISQEGFNNIKSIPEKTNTTIPDIQIKPPTAKKQLSITFSEEVEEMPKLRRVSNNIEEYPEVASIQKDEVKTKSSSQPKRFFDTSTETDDDPDDAVPTFAAKNNVFRLDFPDHTVTYGNKIAPYKLPAEVTVGSCLRIFVTEIHSPFKFWFHIYKENHEVDILMYQMERFYSPLEVDDLRIPLECLTPGQVCAACYNDMWHRAEIVAPPVNKSIKVSFMDYGTVAEVEIANVKFLASFFAELPAQALRACLSHIKPRQYHWTHDATYHFLNLVAELMLYAKITEIDKEKNILYMILCDTNGEEVVKINSSLVENRFAYYNEDWKLEKIAQNNGKHLHHPREDFPT